MTIIGPYTCFIETNSIIIVNFFFVITFQISLNPPNPSQAYVFHCVYHQSIDEIWYPLFMAHLTF